MSKKPSFRDLEKLSAYLDGELNASESKRMKSRLARDPNLLAALDDLRDTRAVLRRIPTRRAPRNFTLSPKMVAKEPPMPRAYPVFRFASAIAFILLFFSALPNFGAPMRTTEPAMMEAPKGFNIGGMETEEMAEMPAEEAPSFAESAPAAEEPAPILETEAEKTTGDNAAETAMPTPSAAATQMAERTTTPMPEPKLWAEAPVSPAARSTSPQAIWQIIFAALAILFALGAFIVRRITISKWQESKK